MNQLPIEKYIFLNLSLSEIEWVKPFLEEHAIIRKYYPESKPDLRCEPTGIYKDETECYHLYLPGRLDNEEIQQLQSSLNQQRP